MNKKTSGKPLNLTPKGRINRILMQQIRDAKRKNKPEPNYTESEFSDWLYAQDDFQTILDKWDAHNNDTAYTPTVSLIDKAEPYTLNNLKLNKTPKIKKTETETEITNQEINENFHQSNAPDKTEIAIDAESTEISEVTHLTEIEYTEEQQLKMYQAEAANLGYQVQVAGTQFAILAAKTGEALSKVKDGLEHGVYEQWVKKNMAISPRQCRTYVKLAKDCPYLLDSNRQSAAVLSVASELLLSHLPDEKIDETRKAIANKDLNQKQSADLISEVQAGADLEQALQKQETELKAEYDKKYQDALINDQDNQVKSKLKTAVKNATKTLQQEKDIAERDKERAENSNDILQETSNKHLASIEKLINKNDALHDELNAVGSASEESKAISLKNDELEKQLVDLTEKLDAKPKPSESLTLWLSAQSMISNAMRCGIDDSAKLIVSELIDSLTQLQKAINKNYS